MAYPVSEEYKNKIYSEDSEQLIDVIINGTTINRDYIKALTNKDNIFETDNFSLGSAVKNEYVLTLDNEAIKDLGTINEISLKFSLVTEEGIEEVPLGTFEVKKSEDSSNDSTKFTLNDDMSKFEVEFDGSSLVPCTRFELLQAICDFVGVELENTSIVNGDVIVNTYDNTILAKYYVMFIAERAGGFAKINRARKLHIKSFNEIDTIELPSGKAGDYKTNEKKIISKVIYENAVQKFEAGDDSGETIFLSQDSPFSCSQEEVDEIYNVLKGLTYQTLEIRVWGDPSIDTGDKIIIDGIESFAQKDWSFGNGFYGKYKTILNKASVISNVEKIPKKVQIRKIQAKLDEVEQTIALIIQDVDGDEEKLTEIIQTLDSITETVEKTTSDVEELGESINLFSTDLDIYNVIVPVDSTSKPKETKKYVVNYYSYFKGKQITPSVSSESTNEGVFVTIGNTIEFSVDSTKIIKNLNNEFIFDFSYTSEGTTYTTIKKVVVTLASQGEQGPQGIRGISGEKGADGVSTFFYIKYSTNANGSPMTDLPADDTEYMGVASTTSTSAPTSSSAYTWSKIKGNQGIQGQTGANGLSSYIHVKYSPDGKVFSEDNGKEPARWRGTYVDNIEADSTTFEDYTWVDTSIFIDEELGEIRNSIIDTDNKVSTLDEDLKTNYMTGEEVQALSNNTNKELEYLKQEFVKLLTTSNEFSIAIESIITNGVNKVKTSTGFTFDEDGLNITKSGEEMHNFIDNQGLYVNRDSEEVLGADSTGVRGENFWAKKYFMIGKNSRLEDYMDGSAIFSIGGDE